MSDYKSQFLARARSSFEEFTLANGLKVYLVPLTQKQMGNAMPSEAKVKDQKERGLIFQRAAVAMAMCDPETGKPLFTDQDIGDLFDLNIVKEIFDLVMKQNRLSEDADTAEKN